MSKPPLPLSPAPIAGESLAGFVLRVADLYGHRTLAELGLTIPMPGCAFRWAGLMAVAGRCGIPADTLLPTAYLPTLRPGYHQFGQVSLHRDLFRLGRGRRFCPACLAESHHHRAIWDLAVVRGCSDHRLALLDRCPRCHRSLPWSAPPLTVCSCGCRLTEVAAPQCPPSDCDWLPAFLGMLRGVPPRHGALAATDATTCVHLAVVAGMLLSPCWDGPLRFRDLGGKRISDVSAVMRAGVSAVENWPEAFTGVVSTLRQGSSNRVGHYGVAHELGADIASWLLKLPEIGHGRVIRGAISECLSRDPVAALRTSKSRALGTRPPLDYLTKKRATERLGCSHETFTRSAAEGAFEQIGAKGRGFPVAVAERQVAAAEKDRRRMVSLTEAALRLGTTRSRVRALSEANFLKRQHGALSGEYAFSGAELAFFMADIESRVVDRPTARPCSLVEAAGLLKQAGCTFPHFIAHILGNRLAPVGIAGDRRGLGAVMFDQAEVVEFGRKRREANDLLPLHTAARFLGLKWDVVDCLVRASLLPVAARGARNSRLVARKHLMEFQDEFVTAPSLAREFGASARTVARLLGERGVVPIVGPSVDGSRQYIYARRDIAEVFPTVPPTGSSSSNETTRSLPGSGAWHPADLASSH